MAKYIFMIQEQPFPVSGAWQKSNTASKHVCVLENNSGSDSKRSRWVDDGF